MPGPFTIDASVFLNAFIPSETGHSESKELLNRLRADGVPMIAPTLLLPETAAAISRGQNDPNLAIQFAEMLSRLPNLTLVSLDKLLAEQSLNAAAHYRVRGSDAVYIAVAQRHATALITLDKQQHQRSKSVLQTYLPQDLLSEI
jgi:predicted nucleic acid-binding protein